MCQIEIFFSKGIKVEIYCLGVCEGTAEYGDKRGQCGR